MRRYCIPAFALGIVLGAGVACAQTPAFPTRQLRLVIPFPAGGPVDMVGRPLALRMGEQLGQPVVVDNRAGGGTVIGSDLVVHAPADGHTWLLVTSAVAINPGVIRKMPYDAQRDLAAVSRLSSTPFILFVHPAVPARDTAEFIKLAKSRPGQILFGSSGMGGANHLSQVQFNLAAGVNTVHVPYKGTSPLMTDLIAGQTHFTFSNPIGSLQQMHAGKLKALGVASLKRLDVAPEIPTMSESGLPGFETGVWFAVFTTGGTPRDIVQRINSELIRAVNNPETRQKVAVGGAQIQTSTPDEMAAYLKSETQKWGAVVKAAGVTAD